MQIKFVNDYNISGFFMYDIIDIGLTNLFGYYYFTIKILGIGIRINWKNKEVLAQENRDERRRSKRKIK